MFRFLGVVVAGLLVVSACSSDVAEPSGSVVDEVAGATATTAVDATTTTVDANAQLAAALGVDAPSTTVSSDSDEQAAVDIVYFDFFANYQCLYEFPVCDFSGVAKTRSERYFESTKANYEQAGADGLTFDPGESPLEQTLLMVRRSVSNDDVIGVLSCQRNYVIEYNPDGSVADDSSPAALVLSRVVRSDEGTWLLDGWIVVAEFQPKFVGGNACSEYENSEFPETEAADFLA